MSHRFYDTRSNKKKNVLNGFFGTDISIVSRRNYDS